MAGLTPSPTGLDQTTTTSVPLIGQEYCDADTFFKALFKALQGVSEQDRKDNCFIKILTGSDGQRAIYLDKKF